MLRQQAQEEGVGPATCRGGSQEPRAPCPVLSWQLALGAGGAPPEQAGAGRAGSVPGQGEERPNGASPGLVLPRQKVEGQWSLLGEFLLGWGCCVCTRALLLCVCLICVCLCSPLLLEAWILGAVPVGDWHPDVFA